MKHTKLNEGLKILFFILFSGNVFSQNISHSSFKKIDTIKNYQVRLEFGVIDNIPTYKANDISISKFEYHRLKAIFDNFIQKCTPCFVKSYNLKDILVYQGFQYLDCGSGSLEVFHNNGKIKVKGQYKENHSGNWNDLQNRNYCSVREGKWYYYDLKGKLSKTEKYLNGDLID